MHIAQLLQILFKTTTATLLSHFLFLYLATHIVITFYTLSSTTLHYISFEFLIASPLSLSLLCTHTIVHTQINITAALLSSGCWWFVQRVPGISADLPR